MRNSFKGTVFGIVSTLGLVSCVFAANPEVAQKIKAGALIVDVRSAEEVAEGMYPGAQHIPVDQVEKRMAEFGAKDKPIVLYCKSGRRAGLAMETLKSKGYTNVTNAGGLSDMPQRQK